MLFELALANELVERPGTDAFFEFDLTDIGLVADTGIEEFIAHDAALRFSSGSVLGQCLERVAQQCGRVSIAR